MDEHELYIQIVALDVIYNFVVEKFVLYLKLFRVPNCSPWCFDVDMAYTKVIILNKIYNIIVDIFDLKLFKVLNICFMFLCFEIQNLEFLNHLEYSHD